MLPTHGALALEAGHVRVGNAHGLHAPGHAEVRKIAQRVSHSGQLPVEDGEDAWLGGVENDIVEPKVAVAEALGLLPVVRRHVRLEPACKVFKRRNGRRCRPGRAGRG